MKALTIWPEWALAFQILQKDIENRVWRAPPSLVGQRIALHAGKRIGGKVDPGGSGFGITKGQQEKAIDCYDKVLETGRAAGWRFGFSTDGDRMGIPVYHREDEHKPFAIWWYDECPFGCIFATAKLEWCAMLPVGWVSYYDTGHPKSPWSIEGQYGFRLTEYISLKKPAPCGGNRRFWTVKPLIEELVKQREHH